MKRTDGGCFFVLINMNSQLRLYERILRFLGWPNGTLLLFFCRRKGLWDISIFFPFGEIRSNVP